jgi:hypothetical protein
LIKIVNDNAEVVLYAKDTSIIIISLNPADFTNSASKILHDINKQFTTNLLSLNADKPQYMQFVTKATSLKEQGKSKFLGPTLDNTFSWKNHTDAIVPKLSSACLTVRAVKLLSQESPTFTP